MVKKIICFIVAFCAVISILPMTTEVSYSATSSEQEKLVTHAEQHIGERREEFPDRLPDNGYGIGSGYDWCVWFVQHCASKTGLSSIIPTSGYTYVTTFSQNIVNSKGGKITFVNSTSYSQMKDFFSSSNRVLDTNYKPQKGDLIIYSNYETYDGDYKFSHIGIVYQNNDKPLTDVETIEGNVGNNDAAYSIVKKYTSVDSVYNRRIVAYVTPKYEKANTYVLKYSDGDSSTSYDEDAKIIPSQTIKSGVSTKTSSKKFTKSGYHYDNWYIFRFVDGKAHYWCRNKTTGGSAGWYAYDAIPSTHKKVAFPHGGSIYFTVTKSDIVMYLTPAWEKNTYTLRYSDGISSTSYDADAKIIPSQIIESGVSTKTTDIKFTRTGYYYDNWYIFKLVDGKAHYWCRDKTTGGDGRWYAYDAIPSTHKKVSFAHGGSIYFTLNHGSTIYLTPAWKTSIDLEDICNGSDEILLSETVYTYDGKAKTPSVTVPGLTIGEDYTVSYSNNVNPGKATVTIRGIGTYTGTVTKTFTITSKKSGWQEIDGTWYYFKNGATVKGWLKTGGVWYYFDGKGMMQTGLKTISGEKYYFKSSGAMKTGWQEINSIWYYFKSSGAAATGWQKVSKKWYCFNDENEMMTGLQTISGAKYYLDNSGAMKTGWKQIDGVWYYFKSSGAATTGWQKISNKWYYFNEDSEMQTGLQEIKNEKYYFDGSGAMKTGWKQIDETWYYFTSSGVAAEGWQKMKNVWYYFDVDNEMMVGFVAIDGAVHQFSNDGAWLGQLY